MPSPKDPIKREEWRRNLRNSKLGNIPWNKGKSFMQKEDNPMFGKHHSDETKAKIREKRKLQVFTIETRQKLSASNGGEKNPFYGKRHDEETCKKLRESHLGENNFNWNGGSSFLPYCPKFNRPFKKRVRNFFGNACVECEITQEENGAALSVHHVNYDKMACCNDVKPLFVALCRAHNTLANSNRGFWEDWYTEIINEFYGGKCYLPEVN